MRQKAKYGTSTCTCGTDHPHRNTICYLSLTPSLAKYDTLFQNDSRDEVNSLKYVENAEGMTDNFWRRGHSNYPSGWRAGERRTIRKA
jgi:hypothetical protein